MKKLVAWFLIIVIATIAGILGATIPTIFLWSTSLGRTLTDSAIAPGDYTGYGGLMLIIFAAGGGFIAAFSITPLLSKKIVFRKWLHLN